MGVITVIIVSYRTPALTAAAVGSGFASGADRVIVVDNASEDETHALLTRTADQRLLVLRRASNDGFGTAANAGAAAAVGDTLIFLNSDAELTFPAAAAMVGELDRHHSRAVIGPRLASPDGTIQRSAGLLPGPADLTIRALGLHLLGRWVARFPIVGALVGRSPMAREYASAEEADRPIATSMVSGACFAIGREAFLELGGFDERFFLYFEDADLCRRAAVAGLAIRYVPTAVVRHVGGASSPHDYHFGPMHARSMRQYLGKWYGPVGASVALLVLCLRAVAFTITFRPRAGRAWRALRAAIIDEDPRR